MDGSLTPEQAGVAARSTPTQWLNATLAADAVERGEPIAYHLPTTLIVAGAASPAILDRIEAEYFPFGLQVELTRGEVEWTSELLGEWIERSDFAHQMIQVEAGLMDLVPARLRTRPGLLASAPERKPNSRTHCASPTLDLRLLPDGTLMPCRSERVDRESALGRVGDESLESLWNHKRIRNLRAGLAQANVPALCQRCPHADRTTAAPPEGQAATLTAHFEDQDLAPLANPVEIGPFLRNAGSIGLAASYRSRSRELAQATEQLEDMRAHAANLERRLGGILGSWPYRMARPLIRLIWSKGPPRG